MKFTWDESKCSSNIEKHGIDFADVWQIFNAPLLVGVDRRENYGEDRFTGVGFLKNIIVVIVFSEPDDQTIRVISIRKALKYERENFEQYVADELGEN